MDTRIKIWVRLRDLLAAINALLFHGDNLHEAARTQNDKKAAEDLRAEAELAFDARKNLWNEHQRAAAEMTLKSGPSSTIQENSAPVQFNNQTVKSYLPKGSRDLLIATVMAIALGMVVYLDLQLREAHAQLADAYKDIKTQVWVKQDKEEEKFQKFVAGPYADLAATVKANELLRNDLVLLQSMRCKEK